MRLGENDRGNEEVGVGVKGGGVGEKGGGCSGLG